MTDITNPPVDLTSFIVAEVHRQTSEDALRQHVETQIAKAVKETVDRAFSYGDVRKQIDKVVIDALHIGSGLDVPSYGAMVMAVLRQKLDAQLHDLINNRLAVEMDDILQLAPKEVKLTGVIKAMIDDLDPHDRYGTCVTCIIEESEYSPGSHRIYLDQASNTRKYDCQTQLYVTDTGNIFHLKLDEKDVKNTVIVGKFYGYQKMVFQAYCCGSKFIIDDMEPSTGIGDF